MVDFFKGRWLGCVTLVMACWLAGMGLRSHFLIDFCEVRVQNRHHCFASFHGYMSWSSWDWHGDNTFCMTIPVDEVDPNVLLDFTTEDAVSTHNRQWAIQFVWVVLPLTFLSASLIFWKPRKRLPRPSQR